MRANHTSLWSAIDWTTIFIYLLLVVAGWFSICGATYNFDLDALFAWGSRPMMQLLWIGLALVLGISVLLISPHLYEEGAPLFYTLMLGLCFITIFVAPDIKGSRSWLVLGPIRLQPAEFTKIATALALAWRCSRYGFTLRSWRSYIELSAIILLPSMLVIGQSETGSALVFLSLFIALYREGFTGLILGLGGASIIYFVSALILDSTLWLADTTRADLLVISSIITLFTLAMMSIYGKRLVGFSLALGGSFIVVMLIALGIHHYLYAFDLAWISLAYLMVTLGSLIYLAIRTYSPRYLLIGAFALGSLGFFFSTSYVFDEILEPHQQVRIKVALGIESDLRGKGYNVDQSKIAIGSGGLWGKGFLEGTQTKLNYVPEQDTDFILCTVGEEQGFVGTTALLVVYMIFILRILMLGERQPSTFGRVYAYSIASIFFFHLFINAGMVIGLIPVIGIPLPFFSYGGSSLWGFSFMLFILLGIDARRYNKRL